MHHNYQNSVKTSELEDQYAIIFGLALWPKEPHEIHFFKQSWFSQRHGRQKIATHAKINMK